MAAGGHQESDLERSHTLAAKWPREATRKALGRQMLAGGHQEKDLARFRALAEHPPAADNARQLPTNSIAGNAKATPWHARKHIISRRWHCDNN